MNSEFVGIIFALTAAAAWGSYLVPMKKIEPQPSPYQFQALIASGVFLSSIALVLVLGFSFTVHILGLISGVLWLIGNMFAILSMKHIGLSRMYPMVATASLISFLWGTIVFHELRGALFLGIAGVIAIIAGASIIVAASKAAEKGNRRGILYATIAALCFGSQLVPFKLSGLSTGEFFFSMSLGVLIAGWVIFFIKFKKIDTPFMYRGLISGGVWSLGNLFSMLAVASLGLAVGFPLTQLSVFFGVMWGVFYFKEIGAKRNISKIIGGTLLLFIGSILLTLTK